MPHVLDLHTHSLCSDGKLRPEELPAAASAANPAISHMALSDHNVFAGCREFLKACEGHGIEGFVSAEISGSHPDRPDVEFHFLATFGTQWNDRVAERVDLFEPYFNRLYRIDTENIFLFLEAAATLGIPIPYRQVVQKAVELYQALPGPKTPELIKPPGFGHLRRLLHDRGLDSGKAPFASIPPAPGCQSGAGASFEKEVWRRAGVAPRPTPPITEAYAIFRQASPAVTLAHPMGYGMTPEQLGPFIREWQREIGLIALEAHYLGVLDVQWKALAEELGLLVSPGSDVHGAYGGELGVPVVEDGQGDIPALLNSLRAAGGAGRETP